jgi:hypothetical protein
MWVWTSESAETPREVLLARVGVSGLLTPPGSQPQKAVPKIQELNKRTREKNCLAYMGRERNTEPVEFM